MEKAIPTFGGYHYDGSRGDFVSAEGNVCQLRRRTFQVLQYLTDSPDKIITKHELMAAIWGNTVVTDDSLTQCICEIRKALQDNNFTVLKTVPKRGYVLVSDETSSNARQCDNSNSQLSSLTTAQHSPQVPECRKSHRSIDLSNDSVSHKFIVGPPVGTPELFFGRHAYLARIFSAWQEPPFGHISIIGPRRSGKTSLLQHLQPISGYHEFSARHNQKTRWLNNPRNYRWISINFQDPRMRSKSILLSYLLENLGFTPPDECSLENFMDIVTEHNWTTPTLILMDELEAGLASDDLDQSFWWTLRALTQMTDGLIGIAVASYQHPMTAADNLDKTSPFFNIFSTLELGPFEDFEALEFIESINMPFTKEEQDWVLNHSSRWPCLLQLLCQEKYLATHKNKGNAKWRDNAHNLLQNYTYLRD